MSVCVFISQTLGRERAVPLSNSVSASECLRINFIQKQRTKSAQEFSSDPLPFRQGVKILSNVGWKHSDLLSHNDYLYIPCRCVCVCVSV